MALERVRDILKLADGHQTAVYAFDALDLNTIAAAVEGAERARRPVIVMLYPPMAKACPLTVFAEMVRQCAKGAKVPVGLHLDHCSDPDFILAALKAGFTSVMADGSMLPLEENIAFTRGIVEMAKKFDADVEGELGHVGLGTQTGDYGSEDLYTKPEDARRFAEETGAASLAVAIGSAHGVYVKAPKLSIDRLKEINRATDIPLVLHGGSGIPEDQLVEAFANGINKFNVGTEFYALEEKLSREVYADANPARIFEEAMEIREGLTGYIAQKVALCRAVV